MITQLTVSAKYFHEDLIQQLSHISTSHFIITNDCVLHDAQLAAVQLRDGHIFTDYEINDCYINMYTIFGQTMTQSINIIQPYVYPAMIYDRVQALTLLSQCKVNSSLDLCVAILLTTNDIQIDGHVVFNFSARNMSPRLLLQPYIQHNMNDDARSSYSIQQLIQYHGLAQDRRYKVAPQFKQSAYTLRIDQINQSLNYRLPHRLYRQLYDYLYKRKIQPYHHLIHAQSDLNQTEGYIVFIGFDYDYRGNSKALFEALLDAMPETEIYFITDETIPADKLKQRVKVVSPHANDARSIIKHARIVVCESYPDDDLVMNGHVINLWHGTPIKQLFLDSLEPQQNASIFLYRLRKYNKLKRIDTFITDTEAVNHLFKSSFNVHNVLATGYPRLQYALSLDKDVIRQQLSEQLNIDINKQWIAYIPTWKDYQYEPIDFSQLNEDRVILYKGHPEERQNQGGLTAVNVETEQLLAASDAIVSDYSSVIFDSIALNKPSYLIMDDLAEYMHTRGVYQDVMTTLEPITYTRRDALIEDLRNGVHHQVKDQSYVAQTIAGNTRLIALIQSLM
ncbi:CDP-glycerol glycerophosphotransferase family protein [Macrococcus capreoli]|uniref:CDP-glycerol glycerophosphotransferase family protein n=1 Tax=Macrococcus capreoli TaxID=2982690 RepID=UPI0021D5C388|nr:CDP-glycerol glycerophosphotransferase family protein [Macrococcus sp. TMW 2.2395]